MAFTYDLGLGRGILTEMEERKVGWGGVDDEHECKWCVSEESGVFFCVDKHT